MCSRLGRTSVDISDHRHLRLLRARRERPRSHAAEKRDELAPFHGGYPRPTDHELRIAGLEWISERASQQKAVPLVRVGSVASHPDLRDAPGMSAMPPITTQSVRRNEAS